MTRLWEEHQELVKALKTIILEDRAFLRAELGPGGRKLNQEEQLRRYVERRADPAGFTEVLTKLREKHGMTGPYEVPREFDRYIRHGERLLRTVGAKVLEKEKEDAGA